MKPPSAKRSLPSTDKERLLATLAQRFAANPNRHPGLKWLEVLTRLENQPHKLFSLHAMEESGGEPDVTGFDPNSGEISFIDCSAETPKGRTSVCYDRAGLESRKEHRPKNTAIDMAAAMGIELLNEAQYLDFQKLGHFDTKTSSWVQAPPEVRKLGGALYGERRYGRLFIGHNGAQSYYAARGFRGILRV